MIRGYRADLELDRIVDLSRGIVTVSLSSHRKSDFERFEAYVRRRHDIIDCVATGGGMDYVTSAIHSPRLGQNIALVMVSAEVARIGAEVEVVTASGPRRATIAERPFFDPLKTLAAA